MQFIAPVFTKTIVATVLSAFVLAACASPPQRNTETELLLGTTISVTTYGRTPDEVFDRIFARVLEIEQRMSTSEEDYTMTELMAVNDAAGREPVEVSSDTFEVVGEAVRYSRQTGGAFDVTVQPLVSLWGIGTESPGIPSDGALADALAAVDHRRVVLDPEQKSIFLEGSAMGIDVGGIAKGYAADEARRILLEEGIESALLDFGGNILTIGTKPDGSAWRIGVQAPDESRGAFIGIVEVVDKAVVTSGTYERYFVKEGVRYHHILDTTTGYPVRNGIDSVTILTDQSMRADALSTAVFAMGLEEGMRFVESQPDIEAIFVTSEGELHMTAGMRAYFRLTNGAFTVVE